MQVAMCGEATVHLYKNPVYGSELRTRLAYRFTVDIYKLCGTCVPIFTSLVVPEVTLSVSE